MVATKFWAAARNAALKVVAFWVLAFAAYLALGRQFFPYIERIEPEIEVWLSGQLGTQVEIGHLQGRWERFNPVVYLQDVRIGDSLSVAEMTLAPGIYESLSRQGLSFIRFELRDFSAELFETDMGWQMRGIATPNANPQGFNLDSFVQLISRQQEVQFRDAHLTISPLQAPSFALNVDDGRLTGYEDENFILANATISYGQLDVPVELQIEISQSFPERNRAYISHGTIDLSPWLRSSLPQISQAQIAGEYWLDLSGHEWQKITSRLDIEAFGLQGEFRDLELSDIKMQAYLEPARQGVTAWLDIARFQLQGEAQGATKLRVDVADQQLELRWDSLPAAMVGRWFSLTDASPFWETISPTGSLQRGLISTNFQQSGSMRAVAEMVDLSIQSYGSIPGLTNLTGDLQIDGPLGQLSFSSPNSDFTLPELFDDSFTAVVNQATMKWFSSPATGLLAQGDGDVVLSVDSAFVSEGQPLPVSVDWQSVALPRNAGANGREAYAELQLTIDTLDTQWAKQITANKLVSEGAADIMIQGLQQGTFTDAEFNFLTSVNQERVRESQLFLNAKVSDGQFRFLEGWSAADKIDGDFALTSDGLSLVARSGYYPGFDIDQGALNIDFKTDQLALQIGASSTTEAALDFLKTGPLRPLYGAQLDSWQAYGDVDAFLAISLPLQDADAMTVFARADLKDSELELSNIDFDFSNVNGSVYYSTEAGIFAENLLVEHEQHQQQVAIASALSSDSSTFRLHVEGSTPLAYWGKRFDDAFLMEQAASVSHSTDIVIDSEKTRIQARSPLTGFALDFPSPLNKAASDTWNTSLDVVMDQRGWMTVRVDSDDRLMSFFEMNARNEIQRGTVAFQTPLNVRAENGVYFDIATDQADGDEWWQVIQATRALYATDVPPPPDSVSFEELIAQINISAASVEYLAQPWSDATVTLLRNQEAWLVDFGANEGRGQVFVPHDDSPLFADIEWVELKTGEDEVALELQVDQLAAYSPDDIPAMSVQINKLIWNELDMGSWRAELSGSAEQLTVANVVGQMQGANVEGELVWTVQNGKHDTNFVGEVSVANMYDFLQTMQYAPVLTSRNGSLTINAAWKGSPAYFDFRRIKGVVGLRLNKGAILNAEEYEGVKLIGLLNFTKVLQRLVLDFSDLLETGISFDFIEGELLFDRGFARVGEKLIIDGPATKFRFSGDADLLSDELDIDMVLTVPLSSTFPLVALLAGVSPQAAAAIYVTERFFNDQLESLSSARMHITGSFENPITRFYRPTDLTETQ